MPESTSDDVFEFGPFRLEPREARLSRAGVPVPLTPKVLETLVLLVARAGSLVTRDELMDALWPDTIVSDGNLKQNVWALRKALESGGAEYVETVPRAGYRFVAPVRRVSAGAPAPAPRGNAPLPSPLSSLVGRGPEIASVRGLLERPGVRLVTLTGPGGTGKTRLAIEAARQAAASFEDGVVFLTLAPLTDPAQVLPALAQALHVEEDLFRPLAELVAERLRGKSVLLVFDNFEHLLGGASVLGGLLAASPGVKALVTSRSLLRLTGEHDVAVPPLGSADAAALFAERAAAARAGFALTEENARTVAAICARLDGLPLALELAASRTRFTTPAALLGELERRVDLLASRARDVEDRQRTLTSTIAWSEDLLAEEERAVFRRLSVFAGGFSRTAAEAVGGRGASPILESLVDQSLVLFERDRFGMLETIREFAAERLERSGEAGDTRARHADFFANMARELAPRLLRGEHAPSLEVLASEHDNLRAALAFLTVHDPPRHLELARDLGLFWHLKGHWEEALERLRRALELAPEAPAGVRATALLHLGRLHFFLGAEEDARRELEEGLLLARRTADGTLVARLLEAVAQARMKVGSDASANEAILEALPLARMSGDPAALAEVLVTLGAARAGAGAYAEARAALEEGLALSRASANGLLLGRALYYRGGLALLEGTPEREPLAGAESADTSWSSHILEMRGRVLAARGAVREAIPLVEEGLVSLHDVGSHACLPHSLEGVARLALAGDPRRAEAAARLLGAAERACETLGVAMLPVERALSAQTAAAVRAALPAPAFEAAWREGRGWSAEEAYRRARALLTEL